jgi:anti-sigma-K factor RskA
MEFEAVCNQHPEVLEARVRFEMALEKQAFENAVTPPAGLKKTISESLPSSQGRVVSLTSPIVATKNSWLRYASAAAVVLLAGSIYWNISLYNRNDVLQRSYKNTQTQLSNIENEIAKIRLNPNVKMAAMKGMEASPTSFATVYWDTASHDVYLLANNLPEPPEDKQYQLWALFNGTPVDLGVFEFKKEKLLIQAKNTRGAQAFAITLEKKGGSPTPKGDMYVMGNL